MEDASGVTTCTYNAGGHTTSVANPGARRVTYTYIPGGVRQTMVDPDGGVTTYSYDAANRLTVLVNPWNEVTTCEYDALGRATTMTLANGTRTTKTFDAAGRLTDIRHTTSGGSQLSRFVYAYDNAARRTGVLEGSGDRVTWTYDSAGRLVREERDGSNAYDITYTYDGVGNRLTKVASGATTTYSYDAADELTSLNEAGTLTTYTYNGNGSPLIENAAGTVTTYTWNDENRLSVLQPGTGEVSTMTYRADGMRTSRQAGATTTQFVWDGQKVLQEVQSGATAAQYTLSGGAGVSAGGPYGDLVSQRRSSASQWFHFDALGSTDRLTDSSEAVTDNYTYEAFGEVLAASGSTPNPYRYVGKLGYFDNGEGPVYVRARHYEPGVGRFVSREPGWAGAYRRLGDLPGVVYADGAPTDCVDASGLDALCSSCREQADAWTLRCERLQAQLSDPDYIASMAVNAPDVLYEQYLHFRYDCVGSPDEAGPMWTEGQGLAQLRAISGFSDDRLSVRLRPGGPWISISDVRLPAPPVTCRHQAGAQPAWIPTLQDCRDLFSRRSRELAVAALKDLFFDLLGAAGPTMAWDTLGVTIDALVDNWGDWDALWEQWITNMLLNLDVNLGDWLLSARAALAEEAASRWAVRTPSGGWVTVAALSGYLLRATWSYSVDVLNFYNNDYLDCLRQGGHITAIEEYQISEWMAFGQMSWLWVNTLPELTAARASLRGCLE